MPRRPPTFCPSPLPGLPRRAADARRGNARSRGYTRAWERARAAYLLSNPICVECDRRGDCTAAAVVDHVTPHRGNQALFWDEANWQALCVPCHNRKTAQGL